MIKSYNHMHGCENPAKFSVFFKKTNGQLKLLTLADIRVSSC